MIGRRSDLPFDRDANARYLPWLIAFMVFLAVLALAGMLVLNATASRWDKGVRGTMTVQVVPLGSEESDNDRMAEVLKILATTPEISRYDTLDEASLVRLLEPWIGAAAGSGDLPLPRLIDVELNPTMTLDASALEQRLTKRVAGVAVDDHRVWLDRLVRLIETVEAVAVLILLLIVLATIGTVVFTTRTGLAIHREAIEVLHLIGAQDTYIARQFSRRALGLGIWGGVLGMMLALPTLWGLAHLARNMDDRLLPDLGLGVGHWMALGALPVAVALIAMSTARATVLRTLSKML